MQSFDKKDWLGGILLAEWHPYFWITVFSILLYIKTLPFGYTYQDDTALILYNRDFISNIFNVIRAFGQKVAPGNNNPPYYRPFLIISFILNAQIGGTDLIVYHVTNIIIHAAVACLLYVLLLRLRYGREVSFLFSLLFAVHPVLAQAVAWVPGRNDSILAFFIILSFLYFAKFLETAKRRDYFLNMFFFACALFVKESAVMLAPVMIAYLALILRKRLSWKHDKNLLIGWFAILSLWFVLRQIAVKGALGMNLHRVWELFLLYSPAILQFLGKVVFPFNLSVYPTVQDTSYVYGITAVTILSIGLFYSKQKRMNYVLFGFIWFLLFLLPNLIRPTGFLFKDVLEHRIYTSMIGIIFVLTEIDCIKNFTFKNRVSFIAAGIAVTLFFTIAFIHSDNFKDARSFWENAVKTSPRYYLPRINLTSIYINESNFNR